MFVFVVATKVYWFVVVSNQSFMLINKCRNEGPDFIDYKPPLGSL